MVFISYKWRWMESYQLKTKILIIFNTWRMDWTTNIIYHMRDRKINACLRIATITSFQGLIFCHNKYIFFNNISKGSLMRLIFYIWKIQRNKIGHGLWWMINITGEVTPQIIAMLLSGIFTSPRKMCTSGSVWIVEPYLTW